MSEMVPLAGQIVPAGGDALEGQVVRPAEARLAVAGPLDGKVIRSSSSRLDYRQPSVTFNLGFDGQPSNMVRDASALWTYLPRTVTIEMVGRTYRVWLDQKWLGTTSQANQDKAIMSLLIDGDPREIGACRIVDLGDKNL